MDAGHSVGEITVFAMGASIVFHFRLLRAQIALLRRALFAKTFNQKIAFKAAFDRRKILTVFADKILVRDYVASKVGAKYLARAFAITSQPEVLNWDSIPKEFAMKANHGSGWNLIVSDSADQTEQLSNRLDQLNISTIHLHPKNFDRQAVVQLANHWLSRNFWWYPGAPRIPEWAYKKIKPGILIEELLVDSNGKTAVDYKFHMFNGRCEFVNVINRHHIDETSGKIRVSANVMTREWEPVELILNGNLPARQTPSKPENLEEMLQVAAKLSNDIDYVRVDLYNLDGRIVFGELTNYPSAARNTFEPRSFNRTWGKLLKLDTFKPNSI